MLPSSQVVSSNQPQILHDILCYSVPANRSETAELKVEGCFWISKNGDNIITFFFFYYYLSSSSISSLSSPNVSFSPFSLFFLFVLICRIVYSRSERFTAQRCEHPFFFDCQKWKLDIKFKTYANNSQWFEIWDQSDTWRSSLKSY
jgi:hypothetical protein